MLDWANSRDPILQRYGVGGVARAAVSGAPGLAAVMDVGGLKALVTALSEDDPQAQCFAAAALGEHHSCLLRTRSHQSIYTSCCIHAWIVAVSYIVQTLPVVDLLA